MFKRTWLYQAVAAALAAMGVGCNQEQPEPPAPTTRAQYPLPPLTSRRSDLLDLTEGANPPLRVAQPTCAPSWLQPPVWWQKKLCEQGYTKQYFLRTNSFADYNVYAELNPHNVWKVAVNNEDAWDSDPFAGPPNQSLPLNVVKSPFRLNNIDGAVRMGLYLNGVNDNDKKLPYLALSYNRGTQAGDDRERILPWGRAPILDIDASVVLSDTGMDIEAQWVQVWSMWRDPKTGVRYMIRHDLYSPPFERNTARINWNWPVIGSYYYPGAILGVNNARAEQRFEFPAQRVTFGEKYALGTFSIPLEAYALDMFPEFAQIQPDFLGFEIAIEMGYHRYEESTSQPQYIEFLLRKVNLTYERPQ